MGWQTQSSSGASVSTASSARRLWSMHAQTNPTPTRVHGPMAKFGSSDPLVGHHSGIDGYVWPVPVKSGMRKMYRVKLFGEERGYLEELLRGGKAAARTLMHARILLKADEGLNQSQAGIRRVIAVGS